MRKEHLTEVLCSSRFQIVALALLALLYSLPVLLRPGDVLPLGRDFDAHVAPYVFVRETLLAGRFPLWNPYYTTGQPYLADPLSHALYPVVLVPVLIFGVVTGLKAAIVLSLFLTGLGQWTLARVVGVSPSLRLWCAALVMLAGNLASKFSAGQFEYILAYPWIPFSLAFTLMALRSRRVLWVALASLSIAAPVFAGNYYFLWYALAGGAVVAGAYAIAAGAEARSWRPALSSLVLYGGILAFAFGLAAVRLLPSLQLIPTMARFSAPFYGSDDIYGTLKDLLRPPNMAGLDSSYGDAYAFLGLVPFLGLPFLYYAWRQREARRHVIAFAALGIVSVLLVGQAYPYSPFHWLVQVIPFLDMSRIPLRALVLTTCSLAVLSAIGFSFWRPAGWLGHVKGGILALGILTVFVANGYVLYTSGPLPDQGINSQPEEGLRRAITWLRQYDPEVYYVQVYERPPGVNPKGMQVQYNLVAARMKVLDSYYGWYPWGSPAVPQIRLPLRLTPSPNPPFPLSSLPVRGRYMLLPAGMGQAFLQDGYRLLSTVEGVDVLEYDAALPYAFVLPPDGLPKADSVRPAVVDALEPGKVVVTAAAQTGDRVVVVETFYPGWYVRADDGRATAVSRYEGVVSVDALPGTHRYTFEYQPPIIGWGLAVSLITVALIAGLFVGERWREKRP